MTAYYNEHDPKAAAWLRELIKQGRIADGVVDERSIEDVVPSELAGYTQCHFFAGIGGWSYALRLAGWPDDRPVWTGSCPCQPFSAAGKGLGIADERHLWPAFHWLIGQCRPAIVFGEQVASKAGRDWLATVRSDLEVLGYGVGAADLCAAGVGAPHIRQRLYFVAESDRGKRDGRASAASGHERNGKDAGRAQGDGGAAGGGRPGLLADARHQPTRRAARPGEAQGGRAFGDVTGCGDSGNVVHAQLPGLEGYAGHGDDGYEPRRHGADPAGSVAAAGGAGFWTPCDWLPCRDGKARPVEPGTFPLAHGLPARVGRLRGYGNAIVPQVAQAFIESYLGGAR